MSDRAYYTLICAKKHAAPFEERGFLVESVQGDLVTLVDEEGAHDLADWPRVPYFGMHSPGDDYSGGAFACNGRRRMYAEHQIDAVMTVSVGDISTWNHSVDRMAPPRAIARRVSKAVDFFHFWIGVKRQLGIKRARRKAVGA